MSGVLVVGSANVDIVVRAPRRPDPGETVLADGLSLRPGGKGANQACAAVRAGAPARLVAAVGTDSYAEALLRGLPARSWTCPTRCSRPPIRGWAVVSHLAAALARGLPLPAAVGDANRAGAAATQWTGAQPWRL